MSRIMLLILAFASCTITPAMAQKVADEDSVARWDRAWLSAQEKAPYTPSKLARELVRAEFAHGDDEGVDDRATRAFAAALEVELALRLGYTAQETRARLRQALRLESSAGTENGKRMAAKLAKAERDNSSRGKALGLGNGYGKNPGKGKKDQ